MVNVHVLVTTYLCNTAILSNGGENPRLIEISWKFLIPLGWVGTQQWSCGLLW